LGPIAAAAYNLTFQLGFATTQICEAVAIAVQTLLARAMADHSNSNPLPKALILQHLIRLSIVLGGAVAVSLSLFTWTQRDSVIQGLTSTVAVQQASLAIFPAVLVTQGSYHSGIMCLIACPWRLMGQPVIVLKGFAYPVNGIIMGGLDWKFSMLAMWLANIVCITIIKLNVGDMMSLNKIWWALAAFMGTQVLTGIVRFQSRTGIWKSLQLK
jgi:hypothetical protein